MPESNGKAQVREMAGRADGSEQTYSTGELAHACGVSVRTVQFYDEKGLLPPAELTEGGRRVYTERDAAKLRKILLFKSMGLKLDDIREIVDSQVSTQLLIDILEEQDRKLAVELEQKAATRQTLGVMLDSLRSSGELPAQSTDGMDKIMQDSRELEGRRGLRKPRTIMLVVGIICDIFEIWAFVYAIMSGNWWPFAIVMVPVIIVCTLLVRMYRHATAYICVHCRKVFLPRLGDWFFSQHTWNTRKMTCTECGTKGWHAEVSRDLLES